MLYPVVFFSIALIILFSSFLVIPGYVQAERAANRDSDESEHSDDELDEEEEEEDVDALLAEEFDEEDEEEEDDEEMEEDAQDRLKNEIGEVYDDDTSKLASVQVCGISRRG